MAIGELQVEICLSFAGKSRALPHLMWLRSYGESKPIRRTDPSLDDRRLFEKWWVAPSAQEEKDAFIDATASSLEALDTGDTDKTDHREAVVKAGNAYVKGLNASRDNLRYKIGQSVPSAVRDFTYKTYKLIKNQLKTKHTLSEFGEIQQQKGMKVDMDHLREIERILADFHQFRTSD